MKKRQITIRDGFGRVPLTQGYESKIDLCRIQEAQAHNWHAVKNGRTVYAERIINLGGGKWGRESLHSLINKTPQGFVTMHADGDGLNNTTENLSSGTTSQNGKNRKAVLGRTSKYKGVFLQNGRWRARITNENKKTSLGCFDSEVEAALVYNKAVPYIHGEFGSRNNVEVSL